MSARNHSSAAARTALGGVGPGRGSVHRPRLRFHAALRAARAVGRFVNRHAVLPLLRWHVERRRYAELMALDERTLKDIGISRSDIQAIVHGVWQAPSSRASGADRSPPSLAIVPCDACPDEVATCDCEWTHRPAA